MEKIIKAERGMNAEQIDVLKKGLWKGLGKTNKELNEE